MNEILKEWYWLVIFAALVMVAFVPSFLKAKCPQCGKRKLTTVDVDEHVLSHLDQADHKPFLSFYLCEACQARFRRERAGPLKDASQSNWAMIFDQDSQHAH